MVDYSAELQALAAENNVSIITADLKGNSTDLAKASK